MGGIKSTPASALPLRSGGYTKSSRTSGTTTGAMSYTDAIAKLAERLAPGGELEQGEFSRIDKEAQMMANRMEGANISKGLGNVTMGVAPTVTRMGMEAKGQVRNDLLGQYLSTLQSLVNANQQQQSLDNQIIVAANSRTPNAQQGLDAFGKPMSGTLAEAELNLVTAQLKNAMNPTGTAPNAETYPSLFGGGMDLDFGSNPFATPAAQPASIYDPWGPLKGYGELESGFNAGQMPV